MKRINIFILIGGLAILLSAGCLIFLDKIIPSYSQEEINISQIGINKKISLVVDCGEGNISSFQGNFKEGMTAFDLLKEKTEEANLILETEIYTTGMLIKTIGDKENGQDGKYWLYYINGKMPIVSVDNQKLEPGDKIEFKFEKSPF